MFVRYFSVQSCSTDDETFENIKLWDGLNSDLTVLCTLLIVIALWLVTKSSAVVCFVEIDADTIVGDSGSETDSYGASEFSDREYVVFYCCVVNCVD